MRNSTVAANENKSKLMKLAQNLRLLLEERNISENEVAIALNIPVMTVRRLVSGETADPRISTLKKIADFFKVSLDVLMEDNQSKSITLMSKNTPQIIPLLDWKEATTIQRVNDINLKTWKKWQSVNLRNQSKLSNDAFALESKPSLQLRFPLGTIFIVEPNEPPADSDIILIKMKKDNELSLRELVIDPPKWQLQPIVPGSENLFYDENNQSIIGIVILTILHTRKNI